MPSRVKKHMESRMLGNLHVRFGVGVEVEFLGLHHLVKEMATSGVNARGD